jgi:hypothetical protein
MNTPAPQQQRSMINGFVERVDPRWLERGSPHFTGNDAIECREKVCCGAFPTVGATLHGDTLFGGDHNRLNFEDLLSSRLPICILGGHECAGLPTKSEFYGSHEPGKVGHARGSLQFGFIVTSNGR